MDAYNVIYADPLQWLADGSIDYISPQLYWKIGGSQDFSALLAWWADQAAANNRQMFPGHIFNTSYGSLELDSQVNKVRKNSDVYGSIFFSAEDFPANRLGFPQKMKDNYYRYKALVPAMVHKDVIAPNAPLNANFGLASGGKTASLNWGLPEVIAEDDSAYRYVVYRFAEEPVGTEIDEPLNIYDISGSRRYFAQAPAENLDHYYYLITALDRNYNESAISDVIVVTPPAGEFNITSSLIPLDKISLFIFLRSYFTKS